jgi:minichromosome maintenance protein 10
VIRLSRDGATYDVPVEGDWLTIAVVAERGEVKVSGTKEDVSDTESEVENDDGDLEQGSSALESRSKLSALSKSKSETDPKSKSKSKSNSKFKPKPKKRAPRKYINLKLASLPPRRAGRESTSTQGDALLQLLLFEADAIVRSEPNHDEHGKGQKTRSYRGGSGGAYEKWCNLGVGSVIAILNPRVLRPLRVSRRGLGSDISNFPLSHFPCTTPVAHAPIALSPSRRRMVEISYLPPPTSHLPYLTSHIPIPSTKFTIAS